MKGKVERIGEFMYISVDLVVAKESGWQRYYLKDLERSWERQCGPVNINWIHGIKMPIWYQSWNFE